MLKEFFESGTKQKQDKVKEYSIFDDYSELIKLYKEDSASDTDESAVFSNEEGELDDRDDGEMPHYSCCGLTMDGIHSAKLSDDMKAAIKFGSKHLIGEGYVEKVKLLHPDNFQWDGEVCGDADGVITTGIKGRIDWPVHAKSPLDEEFEFSIIRDISCLEEVEKEFTMCFLSQFPKGFITSLYPDCQHQEKDTE